MYTPPFTVSAKAINLISEISANLERFVIRMESEDGIRLRKVNRMKTIHGTLAIEGNTLNEEQVTALLNGKHVVVPAKEVQKVRNAITAYDSFMDFNPYNYKDLLKAHGLLAEWNSVFAHLPVENMIWENQAEYYKAIQDSTDANDSVIFVDFMLGIILDALKSHRKLADEDEKVTAKVTVNQQKILDAIKQNPHLTMGELSEIVGIAKKNIFNNMKKLQEAGLLIRHGADKNGWWEVTES